MAQTSSCARCLVSGVTLARSFGGFVEGISDCSAPFFEEKLWPLPESVIDAVQ